MANVIQLKVNKGALLDYAKAGKEAVRRIRKAMNRILNVGRKEARRKITEQFGVRTGYLRRQARNLRNKVTIKSYEIKGKVGPTPRLMNIYENGATFAHGRGFLKPRPVVRPAREAMEAVAHKELNQVLSEVGK